MGPRAAKDVTYSGLTTPLSLNNAAQRSMRNGLPFLHQPPFISLAEVRLGLVGIFMQVAPWLQVCSREFAALLCTLVGPLLCWRIRAQVLILGGICTGKV